MFIADLIVFFRFFLLDANWFFFVFSVIFSDSKISMGFLVFDDLLLGFTDVFFKLRYPSYLMVVLYFFIS